MGAKLGKWGGVNACVRAKAKRIKGKKCSSRRTWLWLTTTADKRTKGSKKNGKSWGVLENEERNQHARDNPRPKREIVGAGFCVANGMKS